MDLTKYKFLYGYRWDDHIILWGFRDAKGHLYINYLSQDLPPGRCHSGDEKATCRPPAIGSRMSKSSCFCELKYSKALAMRSCVGCSQSRRVSKVGWFLEDRGLLSVAVLAQGHLDGLGLLNFPYAERQWRHFHLNFLPFLSLAFWFENSPSLSWLPLHFSSQIFFLIESWHLGVCFLENTLIQIVFLTYYVQNIFLGSANDTKLK